MKSRMCQVLKLGLLLVAMAGLFVMLAGCGKSQPVSQEAEVEAMTKSEAENDNQDTTPPQVADDFPASDSVADKAPHEVIALETRWEGGVLTMPCTVNGLRLRFIFDTGASSVSISSTEAMFMLKNGYLEESDIGGSVQAVIANGDIVDSTEITLRTVEVGGIVLKDVEATVTHGLDAPLLFGQSAIRQLGTIQMREGQVTIVRGDGNDMIEDFTNTVMTTPLWKKAVEQGWVVEIDGVWRQGDGAGNLLDEETAKDPEYFAKHKEACCLGLMLPQAQLGDTESMFWIGKQYANGTLIPQDFPESYRWHRMAAERGHALSQLMVGLDFASGLGVKKDEEEARRWLAKAAAQGIVEAQYRLGGMYDAGFGGSPDPYIAANWYLKAAEQGHAEAQFNIGSCYRNGEGVRKDIQQAIYWYKKAAEQNHASALNNLALMYEDGIGIPCNKQKALRLYKQAMDIGSEEGEQNYGRLLKEKEEHDRRIREKREYDKLFGY